MTDITVPVPDDRTAEFYQFFGQWLAGGLSLTETPQSLPETSIADARAPKVEKRRHWTGSDEDLEDAIHLWEKYSKPARAMFSLLMDNPDKEFTGGQIAAAIGLKHGAHGVAGVLAWPGRHGQKIGRYLPTTWREDQDAQVSYYWISADKAELFKAAREEVEGAA